MTRLDADSSARPDDHVDREPSTPRNGRLTPTGWVRFGWRQLTSMRTALILLLMLALAAIPGSLFPQRSADPNGVIQQMRDDPNLWRLLDQFQLFDVYTSAWFSAIYLLLFISLIGCVIPRLLHHLRALRAAPPPTPHNLTRLPAHHVSLLPASSATDILNRAEQTLRRRGYRIRRHLEESGRASISAERGYLRETGNLLFHFALVGVLLTIAIGGGYKYTGQRVLVEGQTFVNSRLAFDSFTPGRFITDASLPPFTVSLDSFTVDYVNDNRQALGQPRDFTAKVTVDTGAPSPQDATIKVNEPLSVDGQEIYLLGNGYAPRITVRNPDGRTVFSDTVPFLPQDSNLTSLGVIKVPDGLTEQIGMIGFLYPTRVTGSTGASFSNYPDLMNPVITLNLYQGDLGLDAGTPRSAYSLDTSAMTQLAGGTTGTAAIELTPGASVELPNGLGSVELTDIPRFASFDIARDPTQLPMLLLAMLILTGLALGLFVPRRRIWVRAEQASTSVAVEIAGLARGDDPRLNDAISALAEELNNTSQSRTGR